MKIGIIGTRGIPNAHGGFEQFAEYLSLGLVKKGHAVTVYNSHNHPYQKKTWNGVEIVHKRDPENQIGTAGQFLYDLNCILDSRTKDFDVILQLGYTSSAIWNRFLPKASIIVTNMDGLEWKRAKYSAPVRSFLRYAEYLAVKSSDYLIADSIGIQQYLSKKYRKNSTYIPYGAYPFDQPQEDLVKSLDLNLYRYDMLIARFEPENNIEMILEGFVRSNVDRDFVVVGNYYTRYGQYIRDQFPDERIRFMGKIYDIDILNNLRYYSNLYFHGHSVGGTNPSLLEAMASNGLICAHENIFNRSILKDDAYYFKNSNDVANLMNSIAKENELAKISQNLKKIYEVYTWPQIINKCEQFLLDAAAGVTTEALDKNIKSNIYIKERTSAPSLVN